MNSIFGNLSGTYTSPLTTARNMKSRVPPESALLAYLLFALLVSFAARLPGLLVTGQSLPNPASFIGAQFVAAVLFGALFMYLLAALSRLIARMFGGRGTHQTARLALFWVLLALQPLVILNAVFRYAGMTEGPQLAVSIVFGAIFFFVWLTFLLAMERR